LVSPSSGTVCGMRWIRARTSRHTEHARDGAGGADDVRAMEEIRRE
jgi:hypothetical protein